ncbi:MAG TPA: hypothetical protein VGN11_12310 [Candidatus Baltobacteraceae bacterium]|jgi:hypothetical protein|nr:hypothetical protein [Candidatus Baltobacteraceae bacterium]
MTADADYTKVLDMLAHQRLPAYVSYVDSMDMHGIRDYDGDTHGPQHIIVDTRAKKIIAGDPQHVHIGNMHSENNPILNPAFDPRCYRATSEEQASYNGSPALLFHLDPTCGSRDDYPFTQLYADPSTSRPLMATGEVSDSESGGGAHAGIEQRYAVVSGFVVPSLLNVDVKGTGIVFWLRVHAEESYTNYEFTNDIARARRQSPSRAVPSSM